MHAAFHRRYRYLCTAIGKTSACRFSSFVLLMHVLWATATPVIATVLFCLQYKPSEVLQVKGQPEWFPCATLYFKTCVHKEGGKPTSEDCAEVADVDNDDHFYCKLGYSSVNKVKFLLTRRDYAKA